MDKSLIIDKNSKLSPEDNINQTFGCRIFKACNCKNTDLNNICAFVREDNICKKPPNGWKKQFVELKKERETVF
jgi:hypothetical protein